MIAAKRFGVVDPGMEQRALQLVGLARRAGRAVAGTQAVRDASRRGSLSMVILATDAADSAHQRIARVLEDPAVLVLRCGTRETLGTAVGRSGSVVVGISDPGLARRIAEVRRAC